MYTIEKELNRNQVWPGVASASGLAVGPCFIYNPKGLVLSQRTIGSDQVKVEQQKVASALRIVELETRKLAQLSQNHDSDGISADILEFHREVLRDPELIAQVNERIRSDYLPADRAVFQVFRNYIQKLEVSGSLMFRDRIPDIVDIRSRVISRIQQKEMVVQVKEETVIVCKEITPSEIILFARKNVKGLVAERGGLTSHASIIAKSMGIPFVLEVEGITEQVQNGEPIIVDGYTGRVITQPSSQLIRQVEAEVKKQTDEQAREEAIYTNPGMTACGHRVPIRVNLELEAEIDRVARFKPEGIGLLRTEAYFLDQGDFDGNGFEGHDQIRFLQRAAELVGEDILTVRLYDVGGDKLPSFTAKEENPALGWRGVRVLLNKRGLLRSQLEIIVKTLSVYPCRIWLKIPMLTSVEEVLLVKKELDEVLNKYPDAKVMLGVMIEVPAAALLADAIAPHVDFMSIGTNDLTQYTLAADRNNTHVSEYYQPTHPAIWKLVKIVSDACKAQGIPLSVCGELAANPLAAGVFIGMGVHSLSMAGPRIPDVKKTLRFNTLALLEQTALHILSCKTVGEVNNAMRQINPHN